MKVLLVSDFYPPAIGGLERHVARLARALSARGHDVAVATVGTRSNHMTSTEDGIVVHRLQQAVLPVCRQREGGQVRHHARHLLRGEGGGHLRGIALVAGGFEHHAHPRVRLLEGADLEIIGLALRRRGLR